MITEKCIWYNNTEKDISKLLPIFTIKKNNFDTTFFNNIEHSKSNYHKQNNFYINKNYIDYDIDINKLINKKDESLLRNSIKKESTIKSIISKNDRQIKNYNNIIKTKIFEIYPNKKQQKIIFGWMHECLKVYNTCIDLQNKKELDLNYMKSKLTIFNILYNNSAKNAPYDMLTDEVRSCCSNIKSAISNLKVGHITHFLMKYKNAKKGQSILIPKKSINENGIFTSLLKDMKGFEKIDTSIIECDSRLIYDKTYKKFYLKCPLYFEKIQVLNRSEIVALDPGEKIFMSYYSLNNCGHIGYNLREKILKIQSKIKILQKNIKKNTNKTKKKINNKNKIKNKINKYYKKIQNIVKELHNKTALYLVRHYNTILLPEFKTQNIVKCFGKKFIKNKVKEIKDTIINKEDQKKEFRKYTKIKQLSKKSKFLLNSLSHYKFKQHLINKGNEYGCKIKIVTEEYTSQCCSNCGILSNNYNYRLKICPNCDLKIDRDINGSRNILIKNWKDNYKIIKKTCMSCK